MAMSAALQRRRWLIIGGFNVYPNLYVILVTKPNGGKTMAINASLTVLKLLSAGKAPTLPDSVTRASMLDRLTEAFHSEDLDVWHGASLFVDELSILLHEYDRDLISHLSKLWDCPDIFEESRRHNVKQQVRLERPYLSIFAGVQPTVLGAILPEHAWQQGFCSRTIFAFSDEVIPFDTKIFNPEYSSRRPCGMARKPLLTVLKRWYKSAPGWTSPSTAVTNSPDGPKQVLRLSHNTKNLLTTQVEDGNRYYISLSFEPQGEIAVVFQQRTSDGRANYLKTRNWDISPSSRTPTA
jgi:hypothetical protein